MTFQISKHTFFKLRQVTKHDV